MKQKKRCAQCGTTKWGMVRHYWYRSQFCSRKCRERFLDKLAEDRKRVREWLGFLSRA